MQAEKLDRVEEYRQMTTAVAQPLQFRALRNNLRRGVRALVAGAPQCSKLCLVCV